MTDDKYIKQAKFLYLSLAGIFISLIVTCNLIFLKFFELELVDGFTMVLSVGLIPYPVTFLVTDLISEIYGKSKANQVVVVGLICSVLVMGITIITDLIPARTESPVDDETYSLVFGLTAASVSASMIAYLLAQFIDIKLFHWLKARTRGKKLWLRNNLSTIPSQLIDSFAVISLLCAFGAIPWGDFLITVFSLFVFKMMVAIADTPLLYLFSYIIKRHFNLDDMDELDI